MVPTEDMHRGCASGKESRNARKLFYPGYVLVEMEMNDDTWHLVRSTPRVTELRGLRAAPQPADSGRSGPDCSSRVEVAAEHPMSRN